jgi:PAS domain S-box-containing protein
MKNSNSGAKDDTEFWGAITAVAVYDKNHNIKYVDGVIRILPRKNRLILPCVPAKNGIATDREPRRRSDRNRRKPDYRLANPAANAILGTESSELVGRPVANTLKPPFWKKSPARNWKKFEKLSNQEIEINHRAATAGYCSSLFVRTGTAEYTAGILAIFRDITDLRKMEMDMLKATKLESVGILAGALPMISQYSDDYLGISHFVNWLPNRRLDPEVVG